MRIVSVVAGCIGLLVAAYVADRWLLEIQMNVGSFGGTAGWLEIGLVASLVPRLLLLGGLAAVLSAVRASGHRVGSAVALAIGAIAGVVPSLLLGVHVAMQPDGLPFFEMSVETAPIWSGTGAFLPWVGIGLATVGLVGIVTARRSDRRGSLRPAVVAGGAVIAFGATYLLDEAFASQAIGLATGLEDYPAFIALGLAIRAAVMIAIILALSLAVTHGFDRATTLALVGIGLLGFVVLPTAGLFADPFPVPTADSLAATLDPGTAGRWLAGGLLVAGGIGWWRTRRRTVLLADGARMAAEADVA
jgi:hypothetical protein